MRIPRGISAAAPSLASLSPQTSIVGLRYCDSSYITSLTSGASTSYNFSANGLYDPNVSGTGHQPIGFDQYMQFYQHYTVLKSTITVQFYLLEAAATSCVVGIALRDTTTALSDSNRVREVGNVIWKPLSPSTIGKTVSMSRTFDMKRFFSPTADSGDSQYRGNTSANPAEDAIFQVLVMANTSEVSPAVYFNVTISYTAELSERKPLAQS